MYNSFSVNYLVSIMSMTIWMIPCFSGLELWFLLKLGRKCHCCFSSRGSLTLETEINVPSKCEQAGCTCCEIAVLGEEFSTLRFCCFLCNLWAVPAILSCPGHVPWRVSLRFLRPVPEELKLSFCFDIGRQQPHVIASQFSESLLASIFCKCLSWCVVFLLFPACYMISVYLKL